MKLFVAFSFLATVSSAVKFPYVTAAPKHLQTSSGDVAEVFACCSCSAEADMALQTCASDSFTSVKIGELPQMTEIEAVEKLEGAVAAWDGGMGAWPMMSSEARIQAVERVVERLLSNRSEMVSTLMYEIGKNYKDAESEVDRTVKFIREAIEELRSGYHVQKITIGSTLAYIKRAAIGVILALGPANYPLNETYAMIIPALLTGNVVVVKIPAVGGLVHLLTLEAFASELPPNTISFVSGGGRKTCPPMMKTGLVDGLAFIGGSKAADDLIVSHPEPHRLKVFSQLEAKNMGIFLEDVFDDDDALDQALDVAVSGSLSYNGQRCTALKIFFVPSSKKEAFSSKFQEKVSSLRVGFPWVGIEDHSDASQITPLPNKKRIAYMQELVEDAKEKGAKVVGGQVLGGEDSTLMAPAVVTGVQKGMKLWKEEQFGPVVAVAWYDDLDELLSYAKEGKYAQQVSLFTTAAHAALLTLTDKFSAIFGKININVAAGRSPDNLAFSGRRSSAMGTMSIRSSLDAFTVETVIATKLVGRNEAIFDKVLESTTFAKQ